MNEYDIAAAYIKERIAVSLGDFRPELAIILGSGLGGLADEVEKPVVIPYGDIPAFRSRRRRITAGGWSSVCSADGGLSACRAGCITTRDTACGRSSSPCVCSRGWASAG